MKLEEQLFQVHFTEDSIPRIVNAKLTKKGIANLENFAIGFRKWANNYQANDRNNWHLTTEQLLEIYKKQL